MKVTKEESFQIAIKNGFQASWTKVALRGQYWHVSGYSKSACPPMYFIISSSNGELIYKNQNSDARKTPKQYSEIEPSEEYFISDMEKPEWVLVESVKK